VAGALKLEQEEGIPEFEFEVECLGSSSALSEGISKLNKRTRDDEDQDDDKENKSNSKRAKSKSSLSSSSSSSLLTRSINNNSSRNNTNKKNGGKSHQATSVEPNDENHHPNVMKVHAPKKGLKQKPPHDNCLLQEEIEDPDRFLRQDIEQTKNKMKEALRELLKDCTYMEWLNAKTLVLHVLPNIF
jgi:hypothetical protein